MFNKHWRRLLLFAAVAAPVFICDRITKNIAQESNWRETPHIVTGFLRFTFAQNDGVAFGIFAGSGERGVWILSALAIIVSFVLLFCALKAQSKSECMAAALMAGGALANAHDRLRFGSVVDFIDAHWNNHHWPAFNIADIAITLGALWLIIILIIPPPKG